MSKHVSRPSNPTIAGCIYLTGKIETWGRGVEKVVRECRKHGCPNPQYSVNPGEPGDIMVRVDAAPDAVVESSANNGGPINGPINEAIKRSQLYRMALKDHGIPYRYEESLTRNGMVTWRPSRQREALGK